MISHKAQGRLLHCDLSTPERNCIGWPKQESITTMATSFGALTSKRFVLSGIQVTSRRGKLKSAATIR
jgi:hypothetical protein